MPKSSRMIILFILILRKHHYIYLFEKCLKRLNCTKNRTTYKIFVSRTTAKMSLCQCRTTKEPSASKEAQCLPCTEGRGGGEEGGGHARGEHKGSEKWCWNKQRNLPRAKIIFKKKSLIKTNASTHARTHSRTQDTHWLTSATVLANRSKGQI